MSDKPTIEIAELRELVEEAAYHGGALYVDPATLLALLDENRRWQGIALGCQIRYEALVSAIQAGNFNEAARLAREG